MNKEGRYRCAYVSFEMGQAARDNVQEAMASVLPELALEAQDHLKDNWVEKNWQSILERYKGLTAFGMLLRQWCMHNPKPLILLMDEIDALVGLSLISVLRQLRSGYPRRPDRFPQSVVLCGMRHLQDYRMELGDEGKQLFSEASPFNINSESLRLGDFSQEDIQTLYTQHTQETGQRFEEDVYKRVFDLTQGQPWLVNALAYDVCFRDKLGLDRSKTITVGHMNTAKERLIRRGETHLGQLMAKLKQERVHRVIESMMGVQNMHPTDEDFEYVTDLGLIRRDDTNSIVVSNPIYREIIPRVLSSSWEKEISTKTPSWGRPGLPLDMNELLLAFQRFFRQHSESWLDQFQYKEAGPQLLLQYPFTWVNT